VIGANERNAAVRRAELLLATGGDPRRRLDLHGRAVTAVADDLDQPERRRALQDGLAALPAELAGLRGVADNLRLLQSDPALAWQTFALALLAEALADDD
jgi:hypothetical protein